MAKLRRWERSSSVDRPLNFPTFSNTSESETDPSDTLTRATSCIARSGLCRSGASLLVSHMPRSNHIVCAYRSVSLSCETSSRQSGVRLWKIGKAVQLEWCRISDYAARLDNASFAGEHFRRGGAFHMTSRSRYVLLYNSLLAALGEPIERYYTRNVSSTQLFEQTTWGISITTTYSALREWILSIGIHSFAWKSGMTRMTRSLPLRIYLPVTGSSSIWYCKAIDTTSERPV